MQEVIIKGYLNYSINENGEIKSLKTGKLRKPRNNGLGYLQIDLYKNGKGKNYYIHKLVAEHFLGALPTNEINHLNGDKNNCNISNLEISTHKENIKHAENNDLICRDKLGKFKSPIKQTE